LCTKLIVIKRLAENILHSPILNLGIDNFDLAFNENGIYSGPGICLWYVDELKRYCGLNGTALLI